MNKHKQQSIRIQKSICKKTATFLYNNNEQTEIEIRKTIPINIVSENKIPRNNLTKNMKDFYKNNNESLKEEIEEGIRK
jgi:outer membrane lipopolysaccharide assembly protein LptE/RlpB